MRRQQNKRKDAFPRLVSRLELSHGKSPRLWVRHSLVQVSRCGRCVVKVEDIGIGLLSMGGDGEMIRK